VGPQLAVDTCARRLRAVDGPRPGGRITWWGPAGVAPDRPGSEATVQALCGLMEVNGRDRSTPRRLGLEVASVAAGLLAAQGDLAAAVAGLRGGGVPAVDTSVLQAGLVLLSHYFVVATGLEDAVPGPPPPAPGPPFRSAEGGWFEIETLDPEAWKRFWTALGADAGGLGAAWTVFRWRYERATCSLPAALHEATGRRALADLRVVATAAGVSLVPLRAYADVLPEAGAGAPAMRPGPAAPPADRSAARGPLPLTGLRVVEATSRIQGPFAGMLLRMLGADVVRVQPPEGDYGRAALTLHRGKEVVQIDLGTPAGRDDLAGLIADADAFVHNWRPGKATEWGLGFNDLAVRHRGLVYASLSGWGERPPAGQPLGTDFLVQAHAGLGDGLNPLDEPAAPSRMILSDLFGGLLGAEAVLAGLYRRERTGQGWQVGSSLLAGAMALQANVLDDIAGGKEDGRRHGRPVWGALDRPVPTIDGLLAVSADDDEAFARLCRRCDVDPDAAPRAALEAHVAAHLVAGTAAEWEEALLDAGVPAARVCEDLRAVPSDPRFAPLFEPVAGGVAPRSPWCFS
jgi:crotonobetainyl-CoA:carnitine CoA-transferase CaiB-like acyl-CoA transferase